MMRRTLDWVQRVTGGAIHGERTVVPSVVNGVSTDTRTLVSGQLYVPLKGERFDGHMFLTQAMEKGAVASLWQTDHTIPEKPGIPLILVENTLKALQAMAAAYRCELGVPLVAVTGSNGKTTTKDLIACILSVRYRVHKTQGNLNNHIGVPLTLLSMPEEAEVAVVEMGMNHAGEIALLSRLARPDLAVVTSIGESHIEFLGSREGITRAKLEIREGLAKDGPILYDGDEPLLTRLLEQDPHPQVRVSWTEGDEAPLEIRSLGTEGYTFRSKRTGTLFHLPLLGRHNIKNALLAVEVARRLGLKEKEIRDGLAQAKTTGMRLELKLARNGMSIIDDAYNASPTSMRAALDLLSELDPGREKWAILGDMREIGSLEERSHKEVGAYVAEKGIARLYTVGERGRWIGEGARIAGTGNLVIRHFATLDEAAEELAREGHPGVLLLVKASRAAQLDRVVKTLTEGA
jgi:UDP-N-acetylmuramoyl-tripeptide--D-alanyl-D-alanine ligase